MADRPAMIDMTDAEVETRYREIIQQQGQDAAMTLMEISRRATLKVRDAALEVRDASLQVHEASAQIVRLSERLERLTKVLIGLTLLLIILAVFPAIDFVMKMKSDHERPAAVVVTRPSRAEPVANTAATETAAIATTATTAKRPKTSKAPMH